MTRRRLQILLSLAIGIGTAIYCHSIYSTFSTRWDYLVWDPAAHGWDGMRLALSVKDFKPLQLLLQTNQLVLWPPLHSYLQIPFFLFFGLEYHSAVLCSLTFLALLPAALTYFYQKLNASWAGWIALMAFSVTSPMVLAYGTMPMLEIFGAVLAAFSAGLFLRRSKYFPLSLSLLFFLKYNYFIYLILPLFVIHFSTANIRFVWEQLKPVRVIAVLASIFVLFSAVVLITGGFKIGGWSVRGIGNPAYILFLVAIAILFWKKQHLVLWKKIRGTGWEWFVIPVSFWLLIPVPNRIKTIVGFAISKPLGGQPPDTLEYYTFYFEKLLLYFANNWAAWLSLVALAVTTIFFRKKREILFVSCLFLVPFLLMTINQNKQERFLLTFVPALWVIVAYAITRIPQRIIRLGTSLLLVAWLVFSLNFDVVRDLVRTQFAPLRARTPINFIAQRISNAPEVRVLGATNELNPASIQYHTGQQSGFSVQQHFDWAVETSPETPVQIICIECESTGKLLRSRTFQDGLVVRHYFLDTLDGASYNPNQ